MDVFKKIMLKTYRIFIQLLLLPIYAVLSIFYGIGCIYLRFMEFSKDFVDSITDPYYLPPIGLGGFYALKGYRQKACEAEAEYDSKTACQYWEKCVVSQNRLFANIICHT